MRASRYIVSSSAELTWCSVRRWSRIRTSSIGWLQTRHGTRDRRISTSRAPDDSIAHARGPEDKAPLAGPGVGERSPGRAKFNYESP